MKCAAQANAIGSILYTAGGLYNTALYQTALTGTTGRKLSQTPKGPDGFPDPYGFIPKVWPPHHDPIVEEHDTLMAKMEHFCCCIAVHF